MKFSGKKVVALIIALMMCSTMVVGFADGETAKIEITKVEVLNSADSVAGEYTDLDSATIRLTEAQLLRVTAEVTGVEDAQISFMSYADDAVEYTDATIQYLDQKAASGGVATFTFRPRSARTGTFVAMTGATSITVADSFDYTVVAADKDMMVKGGKTYYANMIADTTLTITGVIEEITSVTLGETPLSAETDYTVETNETAGTTSVTIKADAIPTTTGTYTVTISAEGYKDGTAEIKVLPALEELDKENVAEAEKALDTTIEETLEKPDVDDEGNYTIDLSDQTVTVAGTEQTITFEIEHRDAGVEEKDGNLVFNPNAENAPFVGKATVKVTMAANVTTTKEVYIIPQNTTISYGNVTALTGSSIKDDAFDLTKLEGATDEAKNESFNAWVADNKQAVTDAKIKALAIGAGRADADTIAAADDTLNFNRDDVISLNEYNIYRKMMNGFKDYGIVDVNNARAQYNK